MNRAPGNTVLGWRALIVVAALAAVPWMPFVSKYHLLLAFDALLFGAIAMSLDLLMGYTGLVPFGSLARIRSPRPVNVAVMRTDCRLPRSPRPPGWADTELWRTVASQ